VTVLKDLRALGVGAVPRAVYEASKKSGAHRLLFRPSCPRLPLRSVGLSRLAPPGSASAELCLRDAKAIVDEGLIAFERRVPITAPDDWVTDPETGRPWPQVTWWTIDIRSDNRQGDVKWVWEIGRHREMVVLARAAALEPGNAEWGQNLDRLLSWWFKANPLETSVHWYSNLEIALRLISWDQVVGLAGDRLTASTREAMATHVTQMRRHLWRDLPYTVSSMRNNHSLGDALGLLLADDMTGRNHSRVRHGVAERMWRGQFRRQINPDGSMIEDSLSYHRFVLEMFIVKWLLGDRSVILRKAIANSSQYLADLGALEGPLPQYGDWDEGRVLATSGDPSGVGNSVALGLVIAGNGEDPEWRERFDLLDWYTPRPSVDSRINAGSVQRAKKAGDFVTAKRGDWQVWLKCGSGPSHGHADLGHVSARYLDDWVLVDPGTGTYNGPLEVRNGFRVSEAHNVLRPLEEGQIEPHRAFRWMSAPTGRAGRVLETPEATVLWGAHDAYVVRHPSPWPWRVARAAVLTEQGLAIVDWREDDAQSAFALTIPLSGQCTSDGRSIAVGEERLALRAPGTVRVAFGEMNPLLGWESRTYGTWKPAPWVVVEGSSSGPVTWSVGNVEISTNAEAAVVDGLRLAVTWSETDVRLSVEAHGQRMDDAVAVGRVP